MAQLVPLRCVCTSPALMLCVAAVCSHAFLHNIAPGLSLPSRQRAEMAERCRHQRCTAARLAADAWLFFDILLAFICIQFYGSR